MCKNTVKKLPFIIMYAPDQYKTLEMCGKVVLENYGILTIFKMGIFRAAHEWVGSQNGSPSLKSVTHILQWWNLAQLYLT